LVPAVRSMVSFKPINLLESYTGLGSFDIVFCRNVLIYFSVAVKAKILQQIAAGLQKDGILFLGASESMSGLSTDFTMVRRPSGFFYGKKS
jgi:chemotaxis protein methyltransferase CheR